MSELEVRILYDAADQQDAAKLADDLSSAMAKEVPEPENRPEITTVAGFANLPDLQEFGPLSVVLVLLPPVARGGFTPEESRVLRQFERDTRPDRRLFPVSPAPDRDKPPPPLQELVSFKTHQLGVDRLATFLLNQLCLRMGSDRRRVFVSYRLTDGKEWSEAVADGLRKRGYAVWRDEDPDPNNDSLPLIRPGSPAQQTIVQAIQDFGLVLVVDTPEAPHSAWVDEEVQQAIRHQLPILPLVIEDPIARKDPKLVLIPPRPGGRFGALERLGNEVRLRASANTGNPSADLNDVFYSTLEAEMRRVLLENLRSRRRLISELRENFRRLNFPLEELEANQLLFRASRSFDSELTPELRFHFLVQCTPYDALLQENIHNLCEHYRRVQGSSHQYALLVHRAPLSAQEKRRLLRNQGDHILLLKADEIENLKAHFQF